MTRAIWSGSISFGLVNVPVRMYSAIEEKDLRFHLLHRKDGSRIGFEKVCKKEKRRIPDAQIAKAYETASGEYVMLEDEDFAAAGGKQYRTIDLCDFVAYDDIDPIYFERTYFLGPAEGAEKVYALLVKAMETSGLAAIGKYVMREKQQLGCLRIREGVITLEKMHFADEIRPVDEIKLTGVKVAKRELEMAAQLIERFTGPFTIEKYKDDYRDRLLAVIRAKQKGETPHVEHEPTEEAPDLMEALRASLEAHSAKRTNGRDGSTGLSELSRSELTKRAQQEGLSGYSRMRKDELVEALAR